jgi:hypothetical protein
MATLALESYDGYAEFMLRGTCTVTVLLVELPALSVALTRMM